MAITQIGVATASQELIAHIKEQALQDATWSDISDAPNPGGQEDKFLGVVPGANPGEESLQWLELPPSGLVWQNADADLAAMRSTGYLVSGGITITLPADDGAGGPLEIGTVIAIADDKAELRNNPLTVLGNGNNIQGDVDLTVDINSACFQLIFDGDEWRITQLNHPTNLSQISEENFRAGQTTYSLNRVPPSLTSILVSVGGRLLPTSDYTLAANVLTLNVAAADALVVRHIGLPPSTQLADAPVGMIGMFPKAQIPVGWIQALGGSVSRNLYPDLVTYITGDPAATEATLPNYEGLYFKGWDRSEATATISIPLNLASNTYGRWMPSLESITARNMWDNTPSNKARVISPANGGGFIGYIFDEPVTMRSVSLGMDSSSNFYPTTSMVLESSDDGVAWLTRSAPATVPGGTGTAVFNVISGSATAKYWRVLGTGGGDSGDGYYWTCTGMSFDGDINWSPAGRINRAVTHSHTVAPATTFDVDQASLAAAHVGSDPIVSGVAIGTDVSTSEPDNAEVVVCIKAFHTQSGTLSDTNVDDLREEVNRLAGIHEDIWSQDQDVTAAWNVDKTLGGGLTVTTPGGVFDVLTAEDGSGKIDWIRPAPGNFTAIADKGYMVDSTTGAVDPSDSSRTLLTVILPTSPVANDFVTIADYNGECTDKSVINVNPSGRNINGVADSFEMNTRNLQLTFTYIDVTQGWRITAGLGESEAPSAIRDKNEYTNVAGQSEFLAVYEVGYLDVFYNGRKLSATDYDATSGTSVVLALPVDANEDIVEIIGYNHVPISEGSYTIPHKGGLTIGQSLDLRLGDNELINGFFQVWQRPGDSTPGGLRRWDLNGSFEEKYGPDRWVAVGREQGALARMEEIDHTGDMTALPGRTKRRKTVRITSDTASSPDDIMAIEQRMEGVETEIGDTLAWTFTYKTDLPEISLEIGRYYGSSSGAAGPRDVGMFSRKITPINDGEWHTTTVTASVTPLTQTTIGTDDDDYVSFTFWASAGSNYAANTDSLGPQTGFLEIAEVKVESGTLPTPMVAPYTHVELNKCQRYYFNTGSNQIHGGYLPANGYANWREEFPVTMRTPPVITYRSYDTNSVNAVIIPAAVDSFGMRNSVQKTSAAGEWYVRYGYEVDAEL